MKITELRGQQAAEPAFENLRVLTGLFRGSEMLPRDLFPKLYRLEHSLSRMISLSVLPLSYEGACVSL